MVDLAQVFDWTTAVGKARMVLATIFLFGLVFVGAISLGMIKTNRVTEESKKVALQIYASAAASPGGRQFKSEQAQAKYDAHAKGAGPIKKFHFLSSQSTYLGVHSWAKVRVFRDRWYIENIEFHQVKPIGFYAEADEPAE